MSLIVLGFFVLFGLAVVNLAKRAGEARSFVLMAWAAMVGAIVTVVLDVFIGIEGMIAVLLPIIFFAWAALVIRLGLLPWPSDRKGAGDDA